MKHLSGILLGLILPSLNALQAQTHGEPVHPEADASAPARTEDAYYKIQRHLQSLRQKMKSEDKALWDEVTSACRNNKMTLKIGKTIDRLLLKLGNSPSAEPALRGWSDRAFMEGYLVAAGQTALAHYENTPGKGPWRDLGGTEISSSLRGRMAAIFQIGENRRKFYGSDKDVFKPGLTWSSWLGTIESVVHTPVGLRPAKLQFLDFSMACLAVGQAPKGIEKSVFENWSRHSMLAFRDVGSPGYAGLTDKTFYYNEGKPGGVLAQMGKITSAPSMKLPAVRMGDEVTVPAQQFDFSKKPAWNFYERKE